MHTPLGQGAWRLEPGETLALRTRVSPVVIVHPPPPGRPLRRWREDPLKETRQQGVSIAVENMARGRKEGIFSVRRCSCHRPEHLLGLGDVILDTSHVGASGVDLMQA